MQTCALAEASPKSKNPRNSALLHFCQCSNKAIGKTRRKIAQIAFSSGCGQNGQHVKPEPKFATVQWYALAFGLFLGLCIWKFGNPVILDQKVDMPVTWSDYLGDAWPPHWVNWIIVPFIVWGV